MSDINAHTCWIQIWPSLARTYLIPKKHEELPSHMPNLAQAELRRTWKPAKIILLLLWPPCFTQSVRKQVSRDLQVRRDSINVRGFQIIQNFWDVIFLFRTRNTKPIRHRRFHSCRNKASTKTTQISASKNHERNNLSWGLRAESRARNCKKCSAEIFFHCKGPLTRVNPRRIQYNF